MVAVANNISRAIAITIEGCGGVRIVFVGFAVVLASLSIGIALEVENIMAVGSADENARILTVLVR